MPKRIKQESAAKRRSRDVNKIAHELVDLSTRETDNKSLENATVPKAVSQYMAQIGRKGGRIGGKQRLNTMSAAERHEVAQKAARVRWERHNELEQQN
jgi:hypothetical protein